MDVLLVTQFPFTGIIFLIMTSQDWQNVLQETRPVRDDHS